MFKSSHGTRSVMYVNPPHKRSSHNMPNQMQCYHLPPSKKRTSYDPSITNSTHFLNYHIIPKSTKHYRLPSMQKCAKCINNHWVINIQQDNEIVQLSLTFPSTPPGDPSSSSTSCNYRKTKFMFYTIDQN